MEKQMDEYSYPAQYTVSSWSPNTIWMVVFALLACVALLYVLKFVFKKMKPQPEVVNATMIDATTDSPSQTPREKRQSEIARHASTPKEERTCLYCQNKATKPLPAYTQVRSIFDVVFLYFGVTRLDRWRVTLTPNDVSLVCVKHQEVRRGILELELSEVIGKQTATMNNLRARVHTVDAYECDEEMLNEVQVERKGKPKRNSRVLVEQNVRQLTAVNGNGKGT
jgi:hypothetical protein